MPAYVDLFSVTNGPVFEALVILSLIFTYVKLIHFDGT